MSDVRSGAWKVLGEAKISICPKARKHSKSDGGVSKGLRSWNERATVG